VTHAGPGPARCSLGSPASVKTLDGFDFSFATGVPRQQIHELAGLAFIERAENIDQSTLRLSNPRNLTKPASRRRMYQVGDLAHLIDTTSRRCAPPSRNKDTVESSVVWKQMARSPRKLW
jgi:hypothetical protein